MTFRPRSNGKWIVHKTWKWFFKMKSSLLLTTYVKWTQLRARSTTSQIVTELVTLSYLNRWAYKNINQVKSNLIVIKCRSIELRFI